MTIWNTSSGGRRHSRKRHHHYGSRHSSHRPQRPFIRTAHRTPYVQVVVILMALALLGRLAWQGVKYLRHSNAAPSASAQLNSGTASPTKAGGTPADPWLRDALVSLDQSAQSAATGDLSDAETEADRAGSILVTMRLNSRTAPPDFFNAALALLDHIAGAHPENALLVEHVTQTRAELAELRSAMMASPSPGSIAPPSPSGNAPAANAARVSLDGPRQIAAQYTLDPASLGGSYLDATLMADTAEMLMPPSSRSFADKISVENLTLAGAAQTLDGIHWRNVTFAGTHLRYEGGPLDLENVRFVRCRFGFVADARGARLANAIVLGQTSITIE